MVHYLAGIAFISFIFVHSSVLEALARKDSSELELTTKQESDVWPFFFVLSKPTYVLRANIGGKGERDRACDGGLSISLDTIKLSEFIGFANKVYLSGM